MLKKKKTITKNRNQISTVLLIFQVYDFDFKVISQKHTFNGSSHRIAVYA